MKKSPPLMRKVEKNTMNKYSEADDAAKVYACMHVAVREAAHIADLGRHAPRRRRDAARIVPRRARRAARGDVPAVGLRRPLLRAAARARALQHLRVLPGRAAPQHVQLVCPPRRARRRGAAVWNQASLCYVYATCSATVGISKYGSLCREYM